MSAFLILWEIVCFIVVLLPKGDSSGVFEIQLTSLINGWGLTYDGHCCSSHSYHFAALSDVSVFHDDDDDDYYDDDNFIDTDGDSTYNSGADDYIDNGLSEEEDADCEKECRTFLRVCLSHLQHPLPSPSSFIQDSMCSFGSAVSHVLGGNMLDPLGLWQESMRSRLAVDPTTIIYIPFTFSWPGEYTLIVEAWHDRYGNRSTQDQRQLIVRSVQGGLLLPSSSWLSHRVSGDSTADLSFRFRVVCDVNYYGAGCGLLCRESDDAIAGHYRCDVNGSRVCLQGWRGKSCDEAECSPECRPNQGYCDEPNQCLCRPGWRGVHCSQCQTFSGCLHGYCIKEWQCMCHQDWSGSLCNIDNFYCERYGPCENGGTCAYDSVSNYTCTCPQGYGGDNCQHSVCYNGFCLNDGVCNVKGSQRSCQCRRGWQGARCQHREVTCGVWSCSNNSTCSRQGRELRCLCRPGFTGPQCEAEVDECLSSPCQHGGLCTDRMNGYHCQCTPGYAGRNCELALDPCIGFKCFNYGTCITLDVGFVPMCVCGPQFTGRRCETAVDPCVGIACLHGGSCLRIGPSSFHCACSHGYTGTVCQIPPPSVLCEDQHCLNGGTCRRTPTGEVMCACLPGFQGALCESREPNLPVTSMSTAAEETEVQRVGNLEDAGDGRRDVKDEVGEREIPTNYKVPETSGAMRMTSKCQHCTLPLALLCALVYSAYDR